MTFVFLLLVVLAVFAVLSLVEIVNDYLVERRGDE